MPKALIAALIIPLVYGGLMWLLIQWMRARLLGRAKAGAEALEKSGARILSIQPSKGWRKPAEVELELGGKKARYQVQTYSRDYILQSIRLPAMPLPAILVRAEGSFDRLGKSLGLNHEVQLNDPTFDAAAFLESAAPDEVVRRTFENAEVRSRVLELLRLGYRLNLSNDGVGASRIRGFYSSYDAGELPYILQVLEAIQAALPRYTSSETVAPPRRYGAIVGAFVALGLGIMSFRFFPLVHPPLDDMDSIGIFGLGLIAWLVVLVVLSRVFRARPNGMGLLLVIGLLLLFAVPPLFALAIFAINSGLDHGPATTRTAQIQLIARRDHELFFAPSKPGRIHDKVGVSAEVYHSVKIGDTIEIETHPGALGWAWPSNVRRLP